MRIMLIISFVIFAYEYIGIIRPLGLALPLRMAAALLLLASTFRNTIYQYIGGGMFFAPNLPRHVMICGAVMYNFVVAALFALAVRDILRLVLPLLGVRLPLRASSLAVLALSAALTAWGTWEGMRVPEAREQEVRIAGWPRGLDGFRAAVLADIHISALNTRPFIESLVERTNAIGADIILMPGDFVDGLVKDRADDAAPLAGLHAPFGVWGVSGNHEYYSGYEDWMKCLSSLGIKMLENAHTVVTSGDASFILAGIPDKQGAAFGFAAPNLDAALKGAPEGAVVLMAHRPEDARRYAGRASLQISGHTHGGLMPVLSSIIAYHNGGYVRGWYTEGDMKLYVSPGSSLWNGFPMRILDPSEITLLTFRAAD